MERDEGGNRMLDVCGGDLREGALDGRIDGHGTNRCADGIQIAVGGIG